MTWNATEYLWVQAGCSHFLAGSRFMDTGPHSDADFGHLQTTLSG